MTETSDLQQVLNTALAHHQAGRLAQAEPLYRQVLAARPDHPEILHLLGILLHQAGYPAQGVEFILRSAAISPTPQILSNLGEVLRVLNRVNEAVGYLRRSVELNPNFAEGYGNLGMALLDLGQKDQAEKCFDRASKLAPQRPDYHLRLCVLRKTLDDPHGAVLAGQQAVKLVPQVPEAWANLALALSAAKKHDEALQATSRAVSLRPDSADAYVTLGIVQAANGREDDALAAYRKAVELDSNHSTAHRSIAAILDVRGDTEGSIAALERALSLQPNDVEGWINLSALRRKICDFIPSLAAAEKALQLAPNQPDVHGNLGFALLTLGNYERGLAEYEWRWRCVSFTTKPREFDGSMWDGSDPAGRRIFVHCEQGFGDLIQCARYIPLLAARGAKVFMESWPPLATLLGNVQGVDKVVVAGVRPPSFDLHIPLLSLPRIFGTTLKHIPGEIPYIKADPDRVAKWKTRIESSGGGIKVGLVWAGNIKPDASRTCALENFAPLTQVPGVTFISLQKRNIPHGDDPAPSGMKLVDVSEDLRDFSETAAAMMNLDLIITIDTASSHLAGALGRPTFTMLPWAHDWRWMGGEKGRTPWYPTMQLFAQPRRGDWATVLDAVATQLSEFVARKTG